jgi:hypothetical protein
MKGERSRPPLRIPSLTSALKRAAREAARFRLVPGRYDLWHTHFDWYNHGRKSVSVRGQFLAILFRAFERALEQGKKRRRIQIFLSLSSTEPEQDALYVHTPTRNGSHYPTTFRGFKRMKRVPPFLRSFMTDGRYELLHRRMLGGVWYTIRPTADRRGLTSA